MAVGRKDDRKPFSERNTSIVPVVTTSSMLFTYWSLFSV